MSYIRTVPTPIANEKCNLLCVDTDNLVGFRVWGRVSLGDLALFFSQMGWVLLGLRPCAS